MCRRIGEERSLSLGETDDWSRSSDSCRECLFCLSSTSIKEKVGKDLIPCSFFQHKYWIKSGRQLLPLLFRAQVLSKKDITKSRRKIYASFVCRKQKYQMKDERKFMSLGLWRSDWQGKATIGLARRNEDEKLSTFVYCHRQKCFFGFYIYVTKP